MVADEVEETQRLHSSGALRVSVGGAGKRAVTKPMKLTLSVPHIKRPTSMRAGGFMKTASAAAGSKAKIMRRLGPREDFLVDPGRNHIFIFDNYYRNSFIQVWLRSYA